MIVGTFHSGSGLGNMLHRYVATRCLALDLGVDFGMENPELFKGASFMGLDYGKPVEGIKHEFLEEKVINPDGVDIRTYDKKIKTVKDNTRIEGEFQDYQYFGHHLDKVRRWLEVGESQTNIPFVTKEDICVISYRGGEYVGVPDLYLPKEYWENAIANMRKLNPKMQFYIVSDDIEAASLMIPNFYGSHEIGNDWKAINQARYLILSNSSFAILPALLNQNVKKIIAPMHWARHNTETWALPQNKYDDFYYQDKHGNLHEGSSIKL